MKHAYLILAHSDFMILEELVSCIDDERNDIYIHFDKKVKVIPNLKTENANLFLIPDRISVFWGDFSMIKAEYALFETAQKNGPYEYYHLLSGVDLPLKSQDYIHGFFSANAGREFIGYMQLSMDHILRERMQRWYIFTKKFRKYYGIERYIRVGFIRLQEWLPFKRNRGINFKKGSQWVSVTERMVQLLLSKRKWVYRTFRRTFCSDESVFQTLCWESSLRNNLYNTEVDGIGCMRAIGWNADNQLIDWDAYDYDFLKESDALFARKFNSSDMQFIKRISSLSQTKE